MKFWGGGAPENKLLSGRKINRLHTDYKNGKMNIILGNKEVSMKKAFTMAEVLITLGIIGIVAAMTMPMIISKAERMILAQQFKKMYANLSNAINLVSEKYGGSYECYNTSYGNYHTADCKVFWSEMISQMNIVHSCYPGVAGCRPTYKTKAEVLSLGGNVKNTACTMNVSGKVYYLTDGSMIAFQNTDVFFVIDINGKKGPNRWGYDVFYMNLNKKNQLVNVVPIDFICAMKEKGGMYVEEMLRE